MVEAEPEVVVVEAVEDRGPFVVGQRCGQLAQMAQGALGGAEGRLGQPRHVRRDVRLHLHERRLHFQIQVVVHEEIEARVAQGHLAAHRANGAGYGRESTFAQEVLHVAVRRVLVDADPVLVGIVRLLQRVGLHRERHLALGAVGVGHEARAPRQVQAANTRHHRAMAAHDARRLALFVGGSEVDVHDEPIRPRENDPLAQRLGEWEKDVLLFIAWLHGLLARILEKMVTKSSSELLARQCLRRTCLN